MRWADVVKLAPKLRTMRMTRCQVGEAFAIMATTPKVREPVKLDLMLIEADRISGELKWLEEDASVDGIEFDHWGNPVTTFFAAIPNVVYIPRWISSIIDHIPEVRYFLGIFDDL